MTVGIVVSPEVILIVVVNLLHPRMIPAGIVCILLNVVILEAILARLISFALAVV